MEIGVKNKKTHKTRQRVHLESLPTTKLRSILRLLAIQMVPYALSSIPVNAEVGKASGQQPGSVDDAEKQVLSLERLPCLPSYETPVRPVSVSALTNGAGTLSNLSKPGLLL